MQISHIIKKYDEKTVVNDVSFSLPKGKVTSLIGPNGAGKSTVMSIISRLIAADNGSVVIEKKDINKWNSKELSKHLAILTQTNNIQMKLTVEELVAFGRFPHSGGRLNSKDKEMIDKAIGGIKRTCAAKHGTWQKGCVWRKKRIRKNVCRKK